MILFFFYSGLRIVTGNLYDEWLDLAINSLSMIVAYFGMWAPLAHGNIEAVWLIGTTSKCNN